MPSSLDTCEDVSVKSCKSPESLKPQWEPVLSKQLRLEPMLSKRVEAEPMLSKRFVHETDSWSSSIGEHKRLAAACDDRDWDSDCAELVRRSSTPCANWQSSTEWRQKPAWNFLQRDVFRKSGIALSSERPWANLHRLLVQCPASKARHSVVFENWSLKSLRLSLPWRLACCVGIWQEADISRKKENAPNLVQMRNTQAFRFLST